MHPLISERAEAIAALCRKHHVVRLDLFGSAATGQFDPERSDFDFLVELQPLVPVAYARAFDGLHEGLEELLGRRVDLVSARSMVNPYFIRSVEATRQTVYAAA